MTEERRQAGAGYTGYEYREISVPREYVSLCLDSYPCFGWEEDPNYEQPGRRGAHVRSGGAGEKDAVTLYFRRVRSIRSKVELTRLQRQFDAIVSEIVSLESSKRLKASIAAFTVGILGTAFMAGSVFAITSGLLLPCIILAVPAFIGWIVPYFLYRSMEKKKTASVTPLIDSKYDELYTVCERANGLLDQAE